MFLPTGNNAISVDVSANIVHFSLLKKKMDGLFPVKGLI
jgi:hypothetical protein